MNTKILQCPGCGSNRVHPDYKNRRLVCEQCGSEVMYSRATLNAGASAEVRYQRDNAFNFFKEGRFELAYKYAREVLNFAVDYVPAKYIIAFYEENKMKKAGALRRFFNETGEILLENDEVYGLEQLFMAFPYKLIEFEKDVIGTVMFNLEEETEKEELCRFIDGICPFFISKRTSQDYLDRELAELYGKLAAYCNVPKTCFALLASINRNPDSPYAGSRFELKTKNQFFYDNYCMSVGEIIKHMKDSELRKRFLEQYEKQLLQYRRDTGVLEVYNA